MIRYMYGKLQEVRCNQIKLGIRGKMNRGVHPPWGNDASPSVSDVPLCFRNNFLTLWKISYILPFLENFSHFHPPKFLMTFFSHQPQISNFSPILPLSVYFPLFRENDYYFPPTLKNVPPVFKKFTCFYVLFVYLVSPLLWPWCTQCTYWTPLAIAMRSHWTGNL